MAVVQKIDLGEMERNGVVWTSRLFDMVNYGDTFGDTGSFKSFLIQIVEGSKSFEIVLLNMHRHNQE